MDFVVVGLGGGLGALARYSLSLLPLEMDFPLVTLGTNVIGALVIGLIAGLASSKSGLSKEALLFWKTGLCGGFTTFSTFSLESSQLLDQGKNVQAGLYLALSIILSILGVYVGRRLARSLLN